jgi:hypothetical protein
MNLRKALFLLISIAVSHYVFELPPLQNFLVNAFVCIFLIWLKPPAAKPTRKGRSR